VLTDTVTINYSVDLRLVSDVVGAPVDELTALNPSLLRMVTPPDTSFDLHLPAGTATLYEKRIAEVPEARRNAWRYHQVLPDDTLASVARAYRVSVAELAAANQLNESDSISGLEALVVPVAPAAAPSARTLLYTARRGDTLVTIADRFGVSLDQLRRWNKLTGIKVAVGRRLHVAEAANVPHARRGHRRGSSEAREADPKKGSAKEPAAHKKGRASAQKKDRAEKPATAASAGKSGSSSAKSHRAEKPAVKQKSSKRKQK
jgi:membrane-bound lytic murein transglycosylase D